MDLILEIRFEFGIKGLTRLQSINLGQRAITKRVNGANGSIVDHTLRTGHHKDSLTQ